MKLEIKFEISITRSEGSKPITEQSFTRLKKIVERRSRKLCSYCGSIDKRGHVDHVTPLSRGGDDSLDNLVWSCRKCNLSKGSKTVGEWKGYDVDFNKARNEITNNEKDILYSLGLLPPKVDTPIVIDFLKKIMGGHSLANREWEGPGKPFTRTEINMLIETLKQLEIIERVDNDFINKGYRLSNSGEQKIYEIIRRIDEANGNEVNQNEQ